MRTALAASVAAAAKGIFLAVLGLVVVLERRSLSSGAAGTRFARPVPQPESRRIDLPEQVKSLLIMRTALAASVATVAKWISGGCFSGGAGCSGTAVCVVKGSWNRCKEKRFRVPDYENRTCSPCCNRCQMDFWGCFSGGAGCSGTAVCVVKGSRSRCKEKRLCVPDYENRTCSQRCSRCQMDFWGCSSGVAGCSGTVVCVVKGSWNKICPFCSATRKPPY